MVMAVLGAGLCAGAAHAAPVLTITPKHALPGDPVWVKLRGEPAAPKKPASDDDFLKGKIGAHTFHMYPVKGGFEGVATVPPDAPTGALTLSVPAGGKDVGGDPLLSQDIFIGTRTPREVAIDVEEIFVDPPADARKPIAEDQRVVEAAYDQPFRSPLVTSRFVWPRPPRVTGRYGDVRMLNGKRNSEHLGTDLAGQSGAPVKVSNDGTVVLARACFYSGNTVIIHHGAGLYTTYFHLSDMTVKEGESVHAGQNLGSVGSSGRTTGPHLHFAVRADGFYVDPQAFMRLGFRPTAER
jgi:murein DD-endopeptidase MepM/ murein hydrolase activator NlpD